MRDEADVIYTDLGRIDYETCWKLQQRFFDGLTTAKRAGGTGTAEHRLLFCEHPHVYTLGKSARAENLLVDEGFLGRIGATVHRIDRGGDITYHGPGQLVGYPILDLEALGMGLREYIAAIEETVIATLAGFGVAAGRNDGASGVWLGSPLPQRPPEPETGSLRPEPTGAAKGSGCRKICAIGVKSSRFVTMHGFALNVNTDLSYFGHINPCGFTDRGVTSIQRELGHRVDMEAVKTACLENFEKIMNVKIIKNNYANHETLGGEAPGRPRDGS